MKKHIKKALVGILAVSLLSASLFACTGSPEEGPDSHTHNYVTPVIVSPTCTAGGYTAYVCECGELNKVAGSETSAFGEHNYVEEVVAPTCTTTGATLKICYSCGDVQEENVVAALGHDYKEGKVSRKCGSPAGVRYTCNNCGDMYFEEDPDKPATGKHKFGEAWQLDATSHWHACTECGSDDEKTAHTLKDGACEICGYERLVYKLNADGESYTLLHYNGNDAEYTVPATYEGKPVTALGNGAFLRATNLKSVNISNITTLGIGVFNGCTALESVTFSASLTKLPANTFEGCAALKSITLPASLTTIEAAAFKDCTALTSIDIPQSVKTISDHVFAGSGITNITIGNEVTTLGYSAFEGCEALTTVTIGSGVKTLLTSTFEGCANLTNVTLPNELTKIGKRAFYGCSKLATIAIPASVTTIGEQAFQTAGLMNIAMPEGITTVEAFAFADCASLQSVTIGKNVATLGTSAFRNCAKLYEIKVADGNAKYSANGNCLIETASKTLVLGGFMSEIPTDGSVTAIGEYAFSGSGVAKIVLPASVTKIASSAFEGCNALYSITLGTGLTDVASYAFYSCRALRIVAYAGTEAQWGNVNVAEAGNAALAPTSYGA